MLGGKTHQNAQEMRLTYEDTKKSSRGVEKGTFGSEEKDGEAEEWRGGMEET